MEREICLGQFILFGDGTFQFKLCLFVRLFQYTTDTSHFETQMSSFPRAPIPDWEGRGGVFRFHPRAVIGYQNGQGFSNIVVSIDMGVWCEICSLS